MAVKNHTRITDSAILREIIDDIVITDSDIPHRSSPY